MHGKNIIGFELIESPQNTVKAYSPQKGETMEAFQTASDVEVNYAMKKASEAFKIYRLMSGVRKAEFLEAIGDEIMSLGDKLIQRAMEETALPEPRLIGERGRTIGQLQLFANLLREGSWVEASIDTAIPERKPLPKPDIRKLLIPVGPVVVFTASNFPLAFSTAGGDTASALAAGNPVIVKAHESHLGTNELVAGAIASAAKKTGMPDGVFSSLNGIGHDLGRKLVQHPLTKSVAFTGSYNGGMALYELANKRDEPIPVFTEMGSVNPVFVLPERLAQDTTELAKSLAASVTLGVGQFCTNPGLLIGLKSDHLDQFSEVLGGEVANQSPSPMLNPGIAQSYYNNCASALEQNGVEALNKLQPAEEGSGSPVVAKVAARDFIANPKLVHEVFGPFSLIVVCDDVAELLAVADSLPGQLTQTMMATDKDTVDFKELISRSREKCGRLIFNGVPTGVEVSHSMTHGGPFPATSDSRFTSVGTDAIKRFVRPISFQDAPTSILPDELRNSNPLKIWRKINGEITNRNI